MQFDNKEFYISISKGLSIKAINHTNSFVTINREEVITIMHSRKSLIQQYVCMDKKKRCSRLQRYHGQL